MVEKKSKNIFQFLMTREIELDFDLSAGNVPDRVGIHQKA